MSATITLTGILENLTPCADGSTVAVVAHPDLRLQVLFPASLTAAHPDLVVAGRRVTVVGDGSGPAVRAERVEVAY